MESKWPLKSLEELGVQLLDCVHQTPKEQDVGMPYIGIPQMKNGEIDFKASPRIISQEDFLKWTEKVNPSHGDIVLSRRCNPGETAFVPQNVQFALGQNLVLLRPDPKKLHPGYLRWVVQSPFWWDEVEKYRNPGAVFDSLKCADIPKFLVPEPPREMQKSLDSVLLTISEKITLNRQINQTLEQMAQTLFKSWFVDFDPVIDNALDAGNEIPDTLQERAEQRCLLRAKTDFKPLPAETRALFPSEFEETELGWVPKGWAFTSIYDVANIIYGAPFKSEHFNSNNIGLPIIRIRDLKTGTPQNWSDEDHPKKTLIETGDILVGMDAEFKATIWSGVDSYLNQRLFLLQPKEKIFSRLFLKYSIQPLLDIEERAQVGTTVAHIGKKEIDKFLLLVPSHDLLLYLSMLFDNILNRISSISNEITYLIELRDRLLPKLISGELELDALPELPELAEAR